MDLKVYPLDKDRKDDFYKIHCQDGQDGWCYCIAWWTTSWQAWGMRNGEENRERREQLFRQNIFDGYLLYDGSRPIGWCQCAPRDYFTKLRDQYDLGENPAIYAVTCFFIIPDFREIGLTHFFLEKILEDLRGKGIKTVQAFPKRGKSLSPDNIWTGPESAFLKAGFELTIDHPTFPVYTKHLDQAGRPEFDGVKSASSSSK